MGDWTGTSTTKLGIYDAATYAQGYAVRLAGGTSTTKLGIYDAATGQWKLDRNGNGNWDGCTTDLCLGTFGLSSDKPVVGDWNGTGTAKIGTFDPTTGLWELDLNGNGIFDGFMVDTCLGPFGQQGNVPVVGKG